MVGFSRDKISDRPERRIRGFRKMRLTDSQISAHTNFCKSADRCVGALEDRKSMLSLRSHIVAKAAIERLFIRSNDWSCMSATKQGPNYLRPCTAGRGIPARA
jgi:hypothetical protein